MALVAQENGASHGTIVNSGQQPVSLAPITIGGESREKPAALPEPALVPAADTVGIQVPGPQAQGNGQTAPSNIRPTGAPSDQPPAGTAVTEPSVQDGGSEQGATAEKPAPSLLKDPAGAISHMIAEQQRRADLPHDLSPIGMFLTANWVVKVVMIGLAIASLATWTVLIAKAIELAGARARVNRTLKAIRTSTTLADALDRNRGRSGPASLMLRAAKDEADLTGEAVDHAGGDGLKERVSSALDRIGAHAGRRIAMGTGILATIGSTSPFVGLFGTVWGIMNSFIGISEAHTTNLAVVAPGIAEVLLATAIGLVAAIPAVVIYNVFARSVTGYRQLLSDAAAGVERLVSRDLDLRKLPAPKEAAGSALPGPRPIVVRDLVAE